MHRRFSFLLLTLALALPARADPPATGSVSGVVVDEKTRRPVEYASVRLEATTPSTGMPATATAADGSFSFQTVPWGVYVLAYGVLGAEPTRSDPFTLSPAQPTAQLGVLRTHTGDPVQLDKLEVSARRDGFYNSIDRKVYTVGRDLQSATGSASDLLQNVPSVQVDIEGNVSLRGNENVLILVNGKPSTLMSTTNRADVLAQTPADSIERVEVITNPSAKYKPDGTAGIINLVLKRKRDAGWSGSVRTSVGNDRRASIGWSGNYNPGRYNVYATASVRQDDRVRIADETRSHRDDATGATILTRQHTYEHMRPLSRLAQLGADYTIDEQNKVGASASYSYRTFFRTSDVGNLSRAADGSALSDYDRLRTDPEWQKTVEVDARFQHSFAEDGHELAVELKRDRHQELEDNHYTDVYHAPVRSSTFEYTLMNPTEVGTELTAEYVRPLPGDAKLESGYAGEANDLDTDFRGGFLDPSSGTWQVDTLQTNRFAYQDWIHAVYATYGRPLGAFGFLAGLRVEETTVHTNQMTTGVTDRMAYARVHPSLHLTYNLTENHQLQLNYSHRIHRPESDDLNPFPEYQDPYNLRAGNPRLKPEETHSLEAGYQYHRDDTTYLAAAYVRDTYHAFTTVTRYVDAVTLLTTHDNLASNRSGGLELVATRPLGSQLTMNASANAFYSEIDASNLGYSARRSAVAWDGKLNLDWRATKKDLVQFNGTYSARRLTAQGYREPTYVANVGLKHDLKIHNLSAILTVSDLFNSLKERTVLDTPGLHDEITRRRSSRIVYVGLIYTFGKSPRKKDDALPFDNQL